MALKRFMIRYPPVLSFRLLSPASWSADIFSSRNARLMLISLRIGRSARQQFTALTMQIRARNDGICQLLVEILVAGWWIAKHLR